jgi:nucleoside-diphosphate-sugar epimerase
MTIDNAIIDRDDRILITGSAGFLGPAVVESLLNHGFRNLCALVRPSSNLSRLESVVGRHRNGSRVDFMRGNLLSPADCAAAAAGARVIFHLAMGGDKSFPDAFMNSVVTTRNLLEASLQHACLRRFVNVSSFAVYANTGRNHANVLDESCPVEPHSERCGDAYRFAKIRQDDIVREYGDRFGVPYVIVRPGSVYGPGKQQITGRVGIDTFGIFLHLGGSNPIPLTYIDNCADAIVLAGVKKGVEGETFNIVDDELPSSRHLLRLYKRNVRRFPSVYIPHPVSYALCWLWEKYSSWSEGQLPPAFSRSRWYYEWKRTRYSNQKLKAVLGWRPQVPTAEGLARYFEGCREKVDA